MLSSLLKLLGTVLNLVVEMVPLVAVFFAGRASAKPDGTEHARKSAIIDEDVARMSDAALDRELFGGK